MNVKWATRLLVLLLLMIGAATAQAQGTPPPQINTALADLGRRLGTTIQLSDLTQWNFEQNVYTDTALGCTLVSGQAAPQGIPGYRFSLNYNGTTYDYRVAIDGSLVIACDASLMQVTPVVGPTVESPACAPDFAGFLAPRVQVNTEARVIPANTAPNRLRLAPSTDAQQIAQIPPGGTFSVIGGPSCASGFVWWEVVFNGQTGWTAEGQLPDVYFIEPLNLAATQTPVATAAATLPPTVPPAATQAPAQPPAGAAVNAALAGVSARQLSLFNLDANGTPASYAGVTDVSGPNGITLDQMAWSPDGQYLAYTTRGPDFSATLYLTDRAGSTPMELASDLYPLMPISFTADSTQVVYAKQNRNAPPPTPGGNGPGSDTLQVFTQSIMPGGSSAAIAGIFFGVGCGGGSAFPAVWQYMSEAGYEGHGYILAVTPFGILYTMNCTGLGTSLLKLDSGQSVEVGASLSRVAVSWDGARVVGVSAQPGDTNPTLTVVDLQTLQATPLGAAAPPDQVAWGPDGAIYYSTSAGSGQFVPGSETLADMMGNASGVERNNVSIHRVDLQATTDAEIYTASAYGIGRMFVTPDNQWLFFSSIPNGDRWVDALNKGVLTQQATQDQILAYFPIELNRIALATGTAQQVSSDLARATLSRAAFGAAAAPQNVAAPLPTALPQSNSGATPTAQG